MLETVRGAVRRLLKILHCALQCDYYYYYYYGLRSSDLKDSSRTGVDECLDLLHCHSHGSPCFISIQKGSFYCGVENPDFDVGDQLS